MNIRVPILAKNLINDLFIFSGSMAAAFVVIAVAVMFLKAAFPDSVFDVWSTSAVLS